jgi:transcriptional regulator with XRE-family HTH domain
MNYGLRIKQRRLELGLSVDELAKKVGKSRATIYRYENGDIKEIPMSVLEPIVRALHTTPQYLMGWDSDEIYV